MWSIRRHAFFLGLFLALAALPAYAQPADTQALDLVDIAQETVARENLPTTLLVVFLVTIISLAPAILVMTTSFTRIVVVLGFLRQAMATQQTPPNQVLIGLALFLTFFVMMPTYQEVNQQAIQPYLAGEMGGEEAFVEALEPIRTFMFRQTDARELSLFLEIAELGRPDTRDDVPTHVLVPAFIVSELKTAFELGFMLYIPFLIIDMVVASVLMAMGMMMLPPIFISLPFKIIMFVLADGWYLLIGNLVEGFH